MRLSKPTVRRVDPDDLRDLCQDLADRVRDFDPDVVVGIATGGADIAEHLVEALDGRPRLVITRSQRPGTRLKQRPLFSRLLKALPERLADPARWLEVEYREARYYLDRRRRRSARADVTGGQGRPERTSRIENPELLAAAVAGAARVVVVDDTLDSGDTLVGVTRAVEVANPGAQVVTAVIATTWRRPPVQADHVLHPRMLLRLPSSFDA